jgi:hypothetical protein
MTTHLYLVPRLRMSGVTLPLPNMTSYSGQGNLNQTGGLLVLGKPYELKKKESRRTRSRRRPNYNNRSTVEEENC